MTTPFYAVHIGVDSYARPDIPALTGAAADVERWHRYTTHTTHIDATPDQIRCLTGAQATKEAILAAVRWLGEQVGPTGTGLLTFSGHGTALSGVADLPMACTAALCPYDADPDDPSTFLTTVDLEEALGDVAANVTAVLDACYSKAPGSPARCLGDGDAAAQHAPTAMRVLLAASPWQEAMELESGGRWHGAFTFSLLTLLEQWSVVHEPEGVWARVSYGDLMFRTRELLQVLGASQSPVWLGEPRLGMIPFLRGGDQLADGETTAFPDAPKHGEQLGFGSGQGFRIFRLSARIQDGNDPVQWVELAKVVVTDDDIGTVAAPWNTSTNLAQKTEYWFITGNSRGLSASERSNLKGFVLDCLTISCDFSLIPAQVPLFQKACDATYKTNSGGTVLGSTENRTAAYGYNNWVALQVRFSGSSASDTLSAVRFYANTSSTTIAKNVNPEGWHQLQFVNDVSSTSFSYALWQGTSS